MEKYKKAIEDYDTILILSPGNVKSLINKAFCNAKLENYESAIDDYSNVLKIEENNTHALYNRAISNDKIGKLNEVNFFILILLFILNKFVYFFTLKAICDFSKIIEFEPMNANAYLNRGCCYEK